MKKERKRTEEKLEEVLIGLAAVEGKKSSCETVLPEMIPFAIRSDTTRSYVARGSLCRDATIRDVGVQRDYFLHRAIISGLGIGVRCDGAIGRDVGVEMRRSSIGRLGHKENDQG